MSTCLEKYIKSDKSSRGGGGGKSFGGAYRGSAKSEKLPGVSVVERVAKTRRLSRRQEGNNTGSQRFALGAGGYSRVHENR